MRDYHVSSYEQFTADTLVPGFSVLSYIPGSGHTVVAWGTTIESLTIRGIVGVGAYRAGSMMAVRGGKTGAVGQAMVRAAPMLAKGVIVLGTGVTVFATAAQMMAINAYECAQ